jgi:hypothetical protein
MSSIPITEQMAKTLKRNAFHHALVGPCGRKLLWVQVRQVSGGVKDNRFSG